MKVVIIEDEKLTAMDLARTLQELDPDIRIEAMLSSVEDAVAFLNATSDVDLIFSDIELGDGLSFEVFEKTGSTLPVVFCTAYDKYSLEAFRSVGIDYILKPFNKAAVEKTLVKYRNLKESFNRPAETYPALLESLRRQLHPKAPSVLVYQGDKIIPVKGEQIALFGVDQDYSFAFTFEQKKYLVSQSLEQLEKLFAPAFFRANRQFLLNRRAVRDASQYFNRKLLVNLTISFPEQILVGKLKTTAFLTWLTEQ